MTSEGPEALRVSAAEFGSERATSRAARSDATPSRTQG